jgi:hypothetical protein
MGYSLSDHARDIVHEGYGCLYFDVNPYEREDGTKNNWDSDGEGYYTDPRDPEYADQYHFDIDKVEKEMLDFAAWAAEEIKHAKDDCPYAMFVWEPGAFHVTEEGEWHPDTLHMALMLMDDPYLPPKDFYKQEIDIAFRRALKQKREKQ